ncbi:four helix bundle protein [Candidatus Falkowbacteria bacterium RIFOXYB2_FULL_47_14]|uniref:Four helix bundle protein n=1 Tax=Candidatus Falkowbacteria bacterium RIFOXYA2_FULL_47_19 TaxID=1797994 RepID=A0A1F5SIL6_9BACT|nr:MAG: four helix bundle protein [Candidatus Falkowbacteria bacterium RIFOXYA2_FULL_47_19]OGF34345.1 MAG: four helix bundle protein [Candidatus Falkowbacteria bacterium RIFOXYC2_FULL_46_15]OGF42734.1 MAG: four helix bundle protein [Candidatus Falkowbacteria bacterium RIFOXYB2_FULL_47_14]
MNKEDLKNRFKKFALRVIKLTRALPSTYESKVMGGQLLRCGTSSAANYRAACRGKSRPDFISKLGIVEEELDESMFWMEIIIESELIARHLIKDLYQETDELLSIIIKSKITARNNK